MLIHNVINKC